MIIINEFGDGSGTWKPYNGEAEAEISDLAELLESKLGSISTLKKALHLNRRKLSKMRSEIDLKFTTERYVIRFTPVQKRQKRTC